MTTVAAGDPGLVGTVQSAFSGDAPMARELAGVVGVYSVRLLVALLILAVTLWASKRLARLVHRAVDDCPTTTPLTRPWLTSFPPWSVISSSRSG